MNPELAIVVFFSAAAGLFASCATYWLGFDRGIQRGRDEQWVDDIIAAGRRERARRNRLGQFKALR